MSEYQEAEKEAKREAMRETSRTGVASMSEPAVGAVEEYPVRRVQHVVSKHPRASTSQGEPNQRRLKKI